MVNNKGSLYVVAAPSGAGKTSLVKALVDSTPRITVSVSHTTRPKRPGEVDGINYYFVDKTTFQRMVEQNEFLEHATIFDNFYGTSHVMVEQTLASGVDVILEIDWQGHQQIKHLFPDSIGIFILPPSRNELQERLTKRNQDHPDIIKKRLADVKESVSHVHEFDYVVINDDFSHALRDLTRIIETGHLQQARQTAKHAALIEALVGI